MGWFEFVAVFAAFFVSHSIPTRPKIRAALVGVLGQRGFTLAYSALSLLMLAALIVAAQRAPFVLLWGSAPWHYHAVLVGMFGVCLILAFSLGRPNPFSFGGARNETFDPCNPGIVRWMRHPVLMALGLWSGLHLLPNGDLAHVVMFGVFAGFALLGVKLIDRRKKRDMGEARWQSVLARVKGQPLLRKDALSGAALLRLCSALVAYAALLVFHSYVIGVNVAALW